MSVASAIELICQFGILLIALLTYIDKKK
ncbi:putative holin-like toxin [Leuconostoc citreum]